MLYARAVYRVVRNESSFTKLAWITTLGEKPCENGTNRHVRYKRASRIESEGDLKSQKKIIIIIIPFSSRIVHPLHI